MTRPSGRLVATFATANDVHFGEVECGRIGIAEEVGPIFSVDPGEMPYPEVMNHGAIDEMIALRPDTVIVKGDLTDRGTEPEYEAFCAAYGRLGERMHHIRGNQRRDGHHIDRGARAVLDRARRPSPSRCSIRSSRASIGAGSMRASSRGSTSSRPTRPCRCSSSAITTRGIRRRTIAMWSTSASIPTTVTRCAR